jgi:hypothetical protein
VQADWGTYSALFGSQAYALDSGESELFNVTKAIWNFSTSTPLRSDASSTILLRGCRPESIDRPCCSSPFTGTNDMLARVTASHAPAHDRQSDDVIALNELPMSFAWGATATPSA